MLFMKLGKIFQFSRRADFRFSAALISKVHTIAVGVHGTERLKGPIMEWNGKKNDRQAIRRNRDNQRIEMGFDQLPVLNLKKP